MKHWRTLYFSFFFIVDLFDIDPLCPARAPNPLIISAIVSVFALYHNMLDICMHCLCIIKHHFYHLLFFYISKGGIFLFLSHIPFFVCLCLCLALCLSVCLSVSLSPYLLILWILFLRLLILEILLIYCFYFRYVCRSSIIT